MRRIPILLLIAALFLSACGSSTGLILTQPVPTTTPVPKPLPTALARTSTPTATLLPDLGISPDKLQGVEISAWHGWDGSSASLFDQMASEFNLSNKWGIKVSVVPQQNLALLGTAVEKSLTIAFKT